MGQPRHKARTKRTGEGPCAEDGPPPPFRSWQAPPDGLFDVIVPMLTAKQFVVVQLVCKDWSHSARSCLKDATPKRPDVDLAKMATLYPNLTQLNLSHVEGLSTRMLAPLRQLTALRELCLSNVALKQHHHDTTNAAAAGEAAAAAVAAAAAAAAVGVAVKGGTAAAGAVPPSAAAAAAAAAGTAKAAAHARGAAYSPSTQPHPRSRVRGGSTGATAQGGGGGSRSAGRAGPAAAGHQHHQQMPPHGNTGPSSTRTLGSVGVGDGEARGASPSVCDSPPMKPNQQQQQQQLQNAIEGGGCAAAISPATKTCMAVAAGGGDCHHDVAAAATAAAAAAAATLGAAGGSGAAGGGAVSGTVAPPGGCSSPLQPPSPASRIFGGLGEVLLRLSKLQADLCPALTTDAIACLSNLTDLTLDTLVAPDTLAPLGRLRCLAVKKLANAEALERLSGLTALLVNSDSSCASEFLPVCTRLPELQSLTFKTSSTKVLQQPDALCWQGFSRLSSLDLRAPVECLKPGLPTLAELAALRSLSLDLYCASDEELMVTVIAPPNLESLFVSSDRSRSGGVIDVHPNPRLRALRIRLYWTALNLVLPEGVPEPSPLPEPLSEDLDSEPRRLRNSDPDPHSPPGDGPAPADATVTQLLPIAAAAATTAAATPTAAAGVEAAVGPRQRLRGSGAVDLDSDLNLHRARAGAVDVDIAIVDRQEAASPAADAGVKTCGRGRRRRRGSDGSPTPCGVGGGGVGRGGGSGDGGCRAAEGLGVVTIGGRGDARGGFPAPSPDRGPRRRITRSGDGADGAATTIVVQPSSGGRDTAAPMVSGGSSEDKSGGDGGSDDGSSGEEVGFLGEEPSAVRGTAAATAAVAAAVTVVAGHTGRSDEAVNFEENGEADSGQREGNHAAATAGPGPQASRRQVTPRATLRGAGGATIVADAAAPGSGSGSGSGAAPVDGTPRVDCRRGSGGSTCYFSATNAAAAAISGSGLSTPAASNSNTQPPEMELQELCLDACFFLLYGSLVPLLRQFPHLRKLTLDNCLALENGELAQLCELSGLRELSLSGLHLVTDTGLRALGRLPQLTSLRVKGLRKLSVHAAQAYLRQKPIVRRYEEISGSFLTALACLSELRSLALKHLHTVSGSALAAGLGALTHLTWLELKDVHSMSDRVLLALTGHKALQDLSVLHCEGVTSRGRNAVVRSLGHRVALDFEGCSLPDITRPCALPTASTQAQLIDDDQVSSSNQPRRSCQQSNQH